MNQHFSNRKTIGLIFILILCFLLVAIAFLYPYLRYEKSSINNTEILYDRILQIVYLKYPSNTSGQWVQTEFSNIMQAKCYLAQKEIEELLKENRNNILQKSYKNKLSNMVLTSSK